MGSVKETFDRLLIHKVGKQVNQFRITENHPQPELPALLVTLPYIYLHPNFRVGLWEDKQVNFLDYRHVYNN